MPKYLARRLGYSVLVLLGVSLIAFFSIRLAPGDPARLMLPEGSPEEDIQAVRERLGLDRPLWEQYWVYMSGVLQGNLGTSIYFGRPNLELVLQGLGATLQLAGAGMGAALLIAIPFGIAAALYKGTWVDLGAMFFALIGQSMSPVWMGLLVIFVFAVRLDWFPAFGYGTLRHLILPACTVGIQVCALATRMTRSGMYEVLLEDHIVAARAQGIPWWKVVVRYALPNAMIPVVTVVGVQFGHLLGGSIVTEQVFNWPGIGRLAVSAISSRDFPLIQAVVLVVSALYVSINVLVDITYKLIDPRVRI